MPAMAKAATTPIIKSLPSSFAEVSLLGEGGESTQTPSSSTVPGPHRSSKTQTPSSSTVPGPHWVFGFSSTGSGFSSTGSGFSSTGSGFSNFNS